MKAIHGAKAKSDRIDSKKIAVLVRGGLMPVAYAYPADMRATRDLMRRRLLFVRQRGSLLAHIQITHHQYNVDPPGKRITYRSNREGLGEGFEDSSVRHSIAADLALADHYEVTIGEPELAVLRQARIHDPNALALLTSVPGIGKVLALTILYEIHDISRLPSVRDFASYSRLVKCERSSAGKSLGSGGNKIGLEPLRVEPDGDASPSRSGMFRRGRIGIVGTNTRQRSPLDWTPLSLHRLHRRHPLFFVLSAPHPSPAHTGSVLRHAHACAFLEWDGTREPMCF